MGYWTFFQLTVHGTKMNSDGILSMIPFVHSNGMELTENLETEINSINVFEDGDIETGLYAHAKWYDHDEDMLLLSKKFPSLLFCLQGEGEQREDMWISYYLDGRLQTCQASISYDPFDASQLVDMEVTCDESVQYSEENIMGCDEDEVSVF